MRSGRTLLPAWAGTLAVVIVSCSPPPTPPTEPSGTPAPATPPPLSAWPAASPRSTPAAERKSLATATPATRIITPVPPPTQTPTELSALYFSSASTLEQREHAIHDLGEIATPAAGEVLARIFQLEKRQDLKLAALEAAINLPDETCREQKFATLQRAVSPAMAQIVRLGAVEALGQFDDPRVTPALRALAQDRDAEVRQQAIELLTDRQEAPR